VGSYHDHGKDVHLFPWLKDTEIVEGFDVFDYMPAGLMTRRTDGSRTTSAAIQNILYLDPDSNIRGFFSRNSSKKALRDMIIPTFGVDDMGSQKSEDRRHVYSRWQDFPVPNVINNPSQSVLVDNLASTIITNVRQDITNIFNTGQRLHRLPEQHRSHPQYASTFAWRIS